MGSVDSEEIFLGWPSALVIVNECAFHRAGCYRLKYRFDRGCSCAYKAGVVQPSPCAWELIDVCM